MSRTKKKQKSKPVGKKGQVSSSSQTDLRRSLKQKSKRDAKKGRVSPSTPGDTTRSLKQKPTKPHAKKRPVLSSAPGSSSLEAFFADYSPRFQYNATASASLEFYRLCDESGWEKDDPKRKEAHRKFKDALVRQFNFAYGTDVNSLVNWQNLCHVVRVDPVPDDLHACREAVRYTFVNLVDLVDAKNTGVGVGVFKSERKLSEYTISTGKFFPRDNAYAGGLLRYLLRHIHHPRDSYFRSEGGRHR